MGILVFEDNPASAISSSLRSNCPITMLRIPLPRVFLSIPHRHVAVRDLCMTNRYLLAEGGSELLQAAVRLFPVSPNDISTHARSGCGSGPSLYSGDLNNIFMLISGANIIQIGCTNTQTTSLREILKCKFRPCSGGSCVRW